MSDDTQSHAICPGCGWHGELPETADGACPRCYYEVGAEPFRLMTLDETLQCDHGATWNDVDMRAFLRAVAKSSCSGSHVTDF